jgi:acetyltransferase-like isoleucine patch superfamily enzyme
MLMTFARYWCGSAVRLFPGSPFRRLRVSIWRMAGFDIHPSVNIMPTARLICWNIKVGENTYIGEDVMITGGDIRIGANCDIAPRAIIHAGSHQIGDSKRRAGETYGGIIEIGDGTWIGTGAIILAGAKIGKGCIVAAGSVVNGQFPDNVLIAGVPAIVKRELSV